MRVVSSGTTAVLEFEEDSITLVFASSMTGEATLLSATSCVCDHRVKTKKWKQKDCRQSNKDYMVWLDASLTEAVGQLDSVGAKERKKAFDKLKKSSFYRNVSL